MVLYILRPVIPYIEYSLNEEYIAKNLCQKKDIPSNTCNGKCHLKKQLEKTDETKENTPKNTNKKTYKNEINEFINNFIKLPEIFIQSIEIFDFKQSYLLSGYISPHFIPPDKF